MKVFTLPSELPFADTLARELCKRAGDDPQFLAGHLILLPNRRACRGLREAFLRQSEGRPLLLPRMLATGDTEEEELLLSDPLALPDEAGAALPEAIDEHERLFVLSTLVEQWRLKVEGEASPAHNLRLARELARLLDQVEREGLSFDKLEDLVPEEFSEHWQKTLTFLEIVTGAWPALERERGVASKARRERLLIEWQAEAWRRSPPDFPVIAAGTTGSMPAPRKLIAVVAGLPKGEVILPNLDLEADEDAWEAIGADQSHPQFGMALLLKEMGLERRKVKPWLPESDGPLAARRRIVAEALRPAPQTARWMERAFRFPAGQVTAAFESVARIDCASEQEEATVIALALRQTLETSEKTGALVTPDRNLAQRVAVELRRWGIEIDDSGGVPLKDTAVGGYLRLIARLLSEGPSALNLLAALKHPLVRGGGAEGEFRLRLRDFERLVLRGPAPKPDLPTLRALLKDALKDAREGADKEALNRLVPWFEDLAKLLRPAVLDHYEKQPLSVLLELHLRLAEDLASSDDTPGAARLWRGEDGDQSAKLLRGLMEGAGQHPAVRVGAYADLFDGLLEEESVRRPYALHPRLFIWGTVEARLERADLMILGGLNEGAWPKETQPSPWMSRPMAERFGLPLPERKIGLSAHDFAQALGAGEVLMTRADRVEGTPSVPARWLLRLNAFLQAVGAPANLLEKQAAQWKHWARSLDQPEGAPQPCAAPEPCPPAAARPKRASVTDVERLQRDPYAFYAKNVLKLKALDPLEADVTAAERGTGVHDVLEQFCKAFPDVLPAEADAALREAFADLSSRLDRRPSQGVLWAPRLARIADWVLSAERARREEIATIYAERWGRMKLPGLEDFELFGKADRLERLVGGGYRVLDYKTGGVPSAAEVKDGRAPQLVLEAAMLRAGGFEGLEPGGEVAALVYWQLSGLRKAGTEISIELSAAEIDEQLAGLTGLIAHFLDPKEPFRAYPRPTHALRYNDYGHLARIKEWAGDVEEAWTP